jgi:tetratricopeptide (TPR) repeat protein
MPLAALGEFALVSKTLERALETAGQPVTGGTMAHDHEVYMALTEAATESRDAEGLRRHASVLAELAGRDDHKLYLAIAYRGLGLAQHLEGKTSQAETMLHQALALFKEMNARWQRGRTLMELGALEASRRRKSGKAEEYFREALDMFEDLQAVPFAERARAALAAPA